MAKIAFIADVHVGNPTTFGGPVVCGVNVRGNQVLDALEAAVRETEDCDALVVCGDLFDVADPNPQTVARVMNILRKRGTSLLLCGNHDMVSTSPGDHALAPLDRLKYATALDAPSYWGGTSYSLLMVPFQPGDARQWFPEVVASLANNVSEVTRVLAFHLGVIDKDTPSFLRDAHDAIPLEVVQDVMERHGISCAYCGNWHNPKRWGKVIQCGALAPTGWDNPGWDYGQVHVLDTATGHTSIRHIPGPRFLSVSTLDAARESFIEAKRRGCELYLNLKDEAAQDLEEVRSWGVLARAVTDTSDAKEATRAAATAVREAGTLKEALARYVAEMPIEDGVDRGKVLEMAGRYLSQGGQA